MTTENTRRSVAWDINNAGKNYAFLIIAQGFLAIFSFACVWLITHSLGAEKYGHIAAFLSAAQLVQISLWWTANAMMRFGVEEFMETGVISESFWTRSLILGINILFIVGSFPIWMPYLAKWFKLSAEIIPITLAYLVVTALWMHLQFAVQAAKMPIFLAFGQMLERLLTLLGIALTAFFGVLTWERAALIYVFSSAIMLFFGIGVLRDLINWRFWQIEYKLSLIKKILVFSIPIPLYSLLSPLALNYVGSLFIINYLSKTDLGIYTVAYQLYGLIMVLPTLAGSLTAPFFISSNHEDTSENLTDIFFNEVLPAFTTFFSIFGAVTVTVLYFVLPFIFAESFAEVGKLLWILIAAGVIAAPILLGFFPFAMSGESTAMQLIPATISSAVLVAASFWLVPRFGLTGSAWATVISFAVNLIIFALLVHRKAGLGFPKTLFSTLPCVFGALSITIGWGIISGLAVTLLSAGIIFLCGRSYHFAGLTRLVSVLPLQYLRPFKAI